MAHFACLLQHYLQQRVELCSDALLEYRETKKATLQILFLCCCWLQGACALGMKPCNNSWVGDVVWGGSLAFKEHVIHLAKHEFHRW